MKVVGLKSWKNENQSTSMLSFTCDISNLTNELMNMTERLKLFTKRQCKKYVADFKKEGVFSGPCLTRDMAIQRTLNIFVAQQRHNDKYGFYDLVPLKNAIGLLEEVFKQYDK